MSKNDRIAMIILIFFTIISFIIATKHFTKDNFIKTTSEKSKILETYEIAEINKGTEQDKNITEEVKKETEKTQQEEINNQVAKQEIIEEALQKETYNKEEQKKEATTQQEINKKKIENEEPEKQETMEENVVEEVVENQKKQEVSTKNEIASIYKGYETIGKIEIPKTEVNLPILSKQTIGGMEVAPCLACSTGDLNYNGKTLILGHNFRNGKIFSNNHKLQIGDKVYVTTLDGKRVEYIIYNKYIAESTDASYLYGKKSESPEIILSSCTDDEEKTMVIIAKANI